jgi:hypothetical protein
MGIPKFLKKILPESVIYQYELSNMHRQINVPMSVAQWEAKGKPLPPPDAVKRQAMTTYASRFGATVFVETGTFMGDTTHAMQSSFSQLHTIEFDEKLFQKATERFKTTSKIKVWQGDSGKVLPVVLSHIPKNEVCLFWLDGHYSGGVTGKANIESPIEAELEAIYAHHVHHVIMVDDARLFTGQRDYPTLENLEKAVRKHNPNGGFEVRHDMIFITPVA